MAGGILSSQKNNDRATLAACSTVQVGSPDGGFVRCVGDIDARTQYADSDLRSTCQVQARNARKPATTEHGSTTHHRRTRAVSSPASRPVLDAKFLPREQIGLQYRKAALEWRETALRWNRAQVKRGMSVLHTCDEQARLRVVVFVEQAMRRVGSEVIVDE